LSWPLKVLLVFLAFAGIFDAVYLGLYAVFGCIVVAAAFFKQRTFFKKPFQTHFLPRLAGVDGMHLRRLRVQSGKGEVKILGLPSKKMLVGFASVAVVALLAGVVIGATLVQYKFSGAGRIVIPPELGVYSDAACTVEVSAIDFGTFSPGENVTRTLYVRNEGSEAGTLSLATQNWNPAIAKEYLVFSWNLEGSELPGGAVLESQFNIRALSTLTNESGISNFNFDAVIILSIETEAT